MNSIFAQDMLKDVSPIKKSQYFAFDPDLFFASKQSLSQLKTEDQKITYAEFLARKIKRDPSELNPHIQRIQLNYLLQNEEAYFGAVVDLFIVLGSSGLSLKKSILKTTYDLFEKKHASFIKRHLRTGISATQAIPTPESRLSKGIRSASPILIKVTKSRFS